MSGVGNRSAPERRAHNQPEWGAPPQVSSGGACLEQR